MGRVPGTQGGNTFRLSLNTPGSLGCNDAADPNSSFPLAYTPGSLGRNDCADPSAEPPITLGIGKLFMTMSLDRDLGFWDYDPDDLLENDQLCPEFVSQARSGLAAAVAAGLRPRVHEAYRSPERSDELHKKHLEGHGGKAAPGWMSVHNYGLAMDVWLYDRKGHYIDNHVKGWYKLYAHLAKSLSAFLWGDKFDDADHFEYHPDWPKPARGADLKAAHNWAIQAASQSPNKSPFNLPASSPGLPGAKTQSKPNQQSDVDWKPYFWWALGASSNDSPSDAFLSTSPRPVQS